MGKHVNSPYKIIGLENDNYGREQLLILTKGDTAYLLDENDKITFVYAEPFEPFDLPKLDNVTYWRATSKVHKAAIHYSLYNGDTYFNSRCNKHYLDNILHVNNNPWLDTLEDILLVWKKE